MIGRLGWAVVVFYAAALGAIGCVPYLSVMLGETGLSDDEIPFALLGLPIGVMFGGPLWAAIADRTGAPIAILRAATLVAIALGALLCVAETGTGMALALAAWSLSRAPHVALGDTLVVRRLGDDRRSYGRLRAVGSVSFLLVAFAGGFLRLVHPRGPLLLTLALLGVAALAAFAIDQDGPAPRAPRLSEFVALWRRFSGILTVSVLHGIALVAFDNFTSLRVERLGWPPYVAGSAVALAVGVEVSVMLSARWLLDRFGPERLIVLSIAVGVPQWALGSAIDHPIAFVLLQSMRGVAFGAFWVAGVAWFSERAPANLAASAQALLPASSFGLGAIACLTLARTVLAGADTAALYRAVAGVELVALGIALVVVRRPRET